MTTPKSAALLIAFITMIAGCGSQADDGTTSHSTALPTNPTTSENDASPSVAPTGPPESTSTGPVADASTGPVMVVSLADMTRFDDEAAGIYGQARAKIVNDCLAESGYPPISAGTQAIPPQDRRLYPTAEELAAHGYKWRIVAEEQAYRAANPGAVEGVEPSEDPALGELLDVTCNPRAFDTLGWWDYVQARRPLEEAANTIEWDQAVADPDYQAALAKWAQCMATAGYQYDNPIASGVATLDMPGGEDGAKALQLAIVDYGCRQAVQLEQVHQSIIERLTTEWINNNQAALDAHTQGMRKLIDRARSVLAG